MGDFRITFPVLVDPAPYIFAFFHGKIGMDFRVGFGDKLADFIFTARKDGKCGGLHTTCGGYIETTVTGAETGEGPG